MVKLIRKLKEIIKSIHHLPTLWMLLMQKDITSSGIMYNTILKWMIELRLETGIIALLGSYILSISPPSIIQNIIIKKMEILIGQIIMALMERLLKKSYLLVTF